MNHHPLPVVPAFHTSLAALQQQQQQQLPALDDPIPYAAPSTPDSECSLEDDDGEKMSAGSRHECSTPRLLPAAADGPAAAATVALCWEVLLHSYGLQWTQPPLVKDDVFLGLGDDESVMTASSTGSVVAPSSSGDSAPTPCLSPVAAPAEFLCNHEPLFDGIDDLQHKPSTPAASAAPPVDGATLPSPSPTVPSESGDSLLDDDPFDFDDAPTTPRLSLSPPPPPPPPKRQRCPSNDDDDAPRPHKSTRATKAASTATATAGSRRRTKRHPGRRSRNKPLKVVAAYHAPQDGADEHLTVFERLTQSGIDWCRYCGTTEGVNWRPGPWGKRTLCNKHGCDYKGYGIASRLPRLDLSAFANERLEDRKRPVVQQFCVVCHSPESTPANKLVACEGGCSRAYHQHCRIPAIAASAHRQPWCCSTVCRENQRRNKVGPYDA